MIQSVERAARILAVLGSGTPRLGVTEIADRVGLAKPTVHGLLRTLEKHEHSIFLDLHSFIAVMARRFPIQLSIIAGHPAMIATGPLGGYAVETGIVVASTDPVAADVVGARLLDPVLALVVRAYGLVVELAAHGAFEDVGVDESLAVPVRRRACTGREVDDFVGGDAAVRAADPQVARRLLCRELAEELRIARAHLRGRMRSSPPERYRCDGSLSRHFSITACKTGGTGGTIGGSGSRKIDALNSYAVAPRKGRLPVTIS